MELVKDNVRNLVKELAEADAEPGRGFYSYDRWTEAYDRLLTLYGFGPDWLRDNTERLHTAYWDRQREESRKRREENK
jgi:hypothetical protein